MCCRCPPSVGLFSYIYILLTVVVTFYFQHAKSIYVKDSRYADVDRILDYKEFMSSNFNMESEIMRENDHFEAMIGNSSIHSDHLHNIDVFKKGTKRTELDADAMKTIINNKSFCKIMDNYIYYHIGESTQKPVSPCPVQAGFHQIYDNRPEFNDVAMPPSEMPTRKTFRLELIRHSEKIACKQFQFINRGRDNGLLQEI